MRSARTHMTMEERPKSTQVKSLRFLARYLRPYRWQVAIALTAMVFTASAVLGLGNGLRYLVDEGLGKGDPQLLDRSFYVLMGVVLLLAVASYARSYFISRVGEQVIADIRREIFNHVIWLSPGYYETTRTGEILSRMTTDTALLQAVVGNTITFALRNFLLLTGGTILLLITSLKLTSYVFLILPLVVLPIILLGRKVRALSRETQEKVADFTTHIEETLSSIRTVQAYGLEAMRNRDFAQKVDDALGKATERIAMRSMLTSLVIAMIFGAIGLVLWMGGRDVLEARITPGDLSSFVFYSVVVAASVGAISEIIGDLQRAAGAAERIVELLQVRSPIASPKAPEALPETVQGALSLKGVTFHYPTRPDAPSLDGVALDIAPGECVALVGPSGAGKSTLFQLLLRFYDPESGSLSLDGIDIRNLDLTNLRHHFGLVPQDPVIFSSHVWDNIRCARPEASEAEVREAAEAAAALPFIEALPQGFDTFLGEKGVRLSGGQKQRIAIARAILKDPAIFLFDEATSALDSENERAVQTGLERLMKGRTTLIIAHRLSTVRAANRIVVLDQGKVIAEGSHNWLLKHNPLYKRLATLQFAEQ